MVFRTEHYLFEVFVAVDVLPLVAVLQPVCFDVLPQRVHYHRAGLGVDTQKAGKSRVQFELHGLKIEIMTNLSLLLI